MVTGPAPGWGALRDSISGEVVLPGSSTYHRARKSAIANFHGPHPQAVVRCQTPRMSPRRFRSPDGTGCTSFPAAAATASPDALRPRGSSLVLAYSDVGQFSSEEGQAAGRLLLGQAVQDEGTGVAGLAKVPQVEIVVQVAPAGGDHLARPLDVLGVGQDEVPAEDAEGLIHSQAPASTPRRRSPSRRTPTSGWIMLKVPETATNAILRSAAAILIRSARAGSISSGMEGRPATDMLNCVPWRP